MRYAYLIQAIGATGEAAPIIGIYGNINVAIQAAKNFELAYGHVAILRAPLNEASSRETWTALYVTRGPPPEPEPTA